MTEDGGYEIIKVHHLVISDRKDRQTEDKN
jgi:hypothetical protein